MTIKTHVLAAAAVLTLAAPAAALAQPVYGAAFNSHREDVHRVEVRHDDFGRGDFRRLEREREFRRAEELRRLRWEREHARYSYDRPYYR